MNKRDNVQSCQCLYLHATVDVAMAQPQSLKFAFTFCVCGPSLHLTFGIVKTRKVVSSLKKSVCITMSLRTAQNLPSIRFWSN